MPLTLWVSLTPLSSWGSEQVLVWNFHGGLFSPGTDRRGTAPVAFSGAFSLGVRPCGWSICKLGRLLDIHEAH